MRDGEVGAAATAVGDDAQRQQRVLDPALDRDERGEQDGAGGQGADVSGAPQPCVSALEKPKTRREQAGRRGERAGDVDPRPCGRRVSSPSRRTAAIAAGTARTRFTYMHQRQSRYSVSAPPRMRPTAAPEPAITPNTPKALLRSDGIVNVVVSRLRAAGASSAAKPPCSARATTSTPKPWARPPSADAAALTLRQLGNLDGAIAELRESIRLNPRIAKAHAYLGVALRETGDLDAAVTSLREALRIDPAEDDAANALGLVYMQRGDADAAVATFKALVERAPGNGAARHNLGTALMQKGDLQAAVAEFRTLVTAEPGNAEAFYNLGTALKQQDDFTGAEQALREAVRLEPELPEAHFTLGVVLWQTRRPEDAAKSSGRPPGSRPTRKRTTCSARSCARWDRTIRRWRNFVRRSLPIPIRRGLAEHRSVAAARA